MNVHYHVIFFEGVYLDRSADSLKARFVKLDPPSDADITKIVQQISQRVIRQLRKLGYLASDTDAAVATGHDVLVDEAPELARTLAMSVQQRIAFDARASQRIRRIGSGFGLEGERPTLSGTHYASMNGFSLHANPTWRRIAVINWSS